MTDPTLYFGELWRVDRPAAPGDEPRLAVFPKGALAVDARGRILASGDQGELKRRFAGTRIHDFGEDLLLPGFVDAHVHFPQLDLIGARGEALLGWLSRYTFPAEERFADAAVAHAQAERFVTELLANGTTLAAVYGSSHAVSAEALFAACERRGLRAVIGKVSMDRGAPASLLQDAAADARATADLIARWHGRDGRLFAALTPRFALSCSEELLGSLGALRAKHPTVYVQTHYAESLDELAAVRRAFPKDKDYLSVYARFGLIGARTVLGHGIHVGDDELTALARARAAVVHCPTSNLFLGSGLFPLDRLLGAAVPVALGTDVGAGTSLSLWRTMDEAYKIQRLRGTSPSPVRLLDLATRAGAEALGLGAVTGGLDAGKEADFQVIACGRSRLLAARAGCPAAERLAALLSLGDDRLTRAVYVRGREVYRQDR